jgi:predicted Zn-dependent protease
MWYLTPISEILVQEFLLPLVPIEADVEMGQRALMDLKAKRRVSSSSSNSQDVYDPHWSPLIQSVGWELVDVAAQSNIHSKTTLLRQYAWDFGIIQQRPPIVNAFCLPGGIIRVTLPLLQQLSLTEGELAALIGHEMGHAIHRHAQARRLQHQAVSYVLRAMTYDDQDDVDESFGQAMGELLVKSADWLGQQSFSRRDEYQADVTSWELLMLSERYDPRAMTSLLKKLWEYHGRHGGETSWDSTHPGTFDRIEALERKYNDLSANEKRRIQRRNTVI